MADETNRYERWSPDILASCLRGIADGDGDLDLEHRQIIRGAAKRLDDLFFSEPDEPSTVSSGETPERYSDATLFAWAHWSGPTTPWTEVRRALARQLLASRSVSQEDGSPDDSALLDALETRGVVSITFADGSQLNPGLLSLRDALRLMSSPERTPND